MSQQDKPLNDSSPFEAALAGLAPRVEGFDRERLIFLAGQAAAMRERGAGVPPAGDVGVPALAGFSRPSPPKSGTPAPLRRWAWPAAFSAMTAVAASLLVMLCTRTEPMIASAGAGPKGTTANVSGTLRVQPDGGPRSVPDTSPDSMPDWLAIWLSPAPPAEKAADVADAAFPESDPALRAELQRHGLDFRRPRESASGGTVVVANGPLTYYELLNRLQGKGPAGQGGLREMMQ
jgi:hypothetical protein